MKNKSKEKIRKNQSFKKTSFISYKKIINKYWADFEETLQEAPENDTDPRLVNAINALKQIEEWKSNLFIVYLYYGKPSILAEKLNVKVNSLCALLSMIKKEIKWKL